MGIAITVVAVVVVVALIIYFARRGNDAASSSPSDQSSTVAEPTDKGQKIVSAAASESSSQSAPSAIGASAGDVPEEEPAEGVRLDESEEKAAVQEIAAARTERKIQSLRQGLLRTRGFLTEKITSLFKGHAEIDPEMLNRLEETLITSDIGAPTAEWLMGTVKRELDAASSKDGTAIQSLLKQEIRKALALPCPPWTFTQKPFVIMVVGVNGAGKTTTIGKLASQLREDGHQIVLAAADTFRAAAVNQLEIWGRRTGCEVVKPVKEGADPSSVVFDAIKKAIDDGADVVIADTAGRLHTQTPLMEELKKISRVAAKATQGAPHEILLVLDATTGQNALAQVRDFNEALGLTGIALTKLDGTAKGGVIIGICHEYQIPVRYIGIGEAKDSLRAFHPDDFVDALFDVDEPTGV